MKQFLLLIFLASSSFANTPGYWATSQIEKEFVLDSSKPLVDEKTAIGIIHQYIAKNSPGTGFAYPNGMNEEGIARLIYGATACLQIDPFVYTAMIKKESGSFDPDARSETHANGLTQFTIVGMQEVADQLMVRGDALPATNIYFNQLLKSDCLPNYGFKDFGSNYKSLWTMSPANQYSKGSPNQILAMKEMLDEHVEYSIVYGAVLLKTYVAAVKDGVKTGALKHNPRANLVNTYKEALMIYNGEPKRKVAYQRDIMDVYYEHITGVNAF